MALDLPAVGVTVGLLIRQYGAVVSAVTAHRDAWTYAAARDTPCARLRTS
jgi:hypothetical protein